jgi:hypothetical protein
VYHITGDLLTLGFQTFIRPFSSATPDQGLHAGAPNGGEWVPRRPPVGREPSQSDVPEASDHAPADPTLCTACGAARCARRTAAELHLFDTGRFAHEENQPEIAPLIAILLDHASTAGA